MGFTVGLESKKKIKTKKREVIMKSLPFFYVETILDYLPIS